jgi:hypothetical protein
MVAKQGTAVRNIRPEPKERSTRILEGKVNGQTVFNYYTIR